MAMQMQRRAASGMSHISATRVRLGRPHTVAAAGKGFGISTKPQSPNQSAEVQSQPCPCGSKKAYSDCCHAYISKKAKAPTAEALLRSRYTAYYFKEPDYIADTTSPDSKEHPGSRNTYIQSVKATQRRAEWRGLEIISQEKPTDDHTYITFSAAFTIDLMQAFIDKDDKDGKVQKREETADFKRKASTWWYMGSELPKAAEEPKAGFEMPKIGFGGF